jgi:hypothetical protein
MGRLDAARHFRAGRIHGGGTPRFIRIWLRADPVLAVAAGLKAKIQLRPAMPTGPFNRVAHNTLAKKLLGWEPKTYSPTG